MIQVTPEIEAIVLKARAKKAKARAIILRYSDYDKIVSIGEHPDIQEELEQAMTLWGEANDTLQHWQAFAQEEAQIAANAARNEKEVETNVDGGDESE